MLELPKNKQEISMSVLASKVNSNSIDKISSPILDDSGKNKSPIQYPDSQFDDQDFTKIMQRQIETHDSKIEAKRVSSYNINSPCISPLTSTGAMRTTQNEEQKDLNNIRKRITKQGF